MKSFFYFYTTEDAYPNSFQMFSIQHLFFLCLVALCVCFGIRHLKGRTEKEIHRTEKKAAAALILAEWFYYLWNILTCPNPAYTEIIPLHLCSACIYLSALAVFLDNERLRRYIAVTNVLGALIALCYPATVGAMYPVFSYRVLYFFISHGTIIFLGILQIRRFGYVSYRSLKFNLTILSIQAALALCINLWLHTDYLFLGVPPTIGIVSSIYNAVGLPLYLPVAILLLGLLEALTIALINAVLHVFHIQDTAYTIRT